MANAVAREQARPLYDIAADIVADYADRGKNVHYAAEPYVTAMRSLDRVTESYYYDSGEAVVTYALANLGSWRGDTARSVKAELRALL
jgi:hypothetical protein